MSRVNRLKLPGIENFAIFRKLVAQVFNLLVDNFTGVKELVELSCCGFSKIFRFLDRILMEHIYI